MTTIQVRMDERTKRAGQKALNKLGMDMSTAVNIYFQQIILRRGIPFQILTENGLTIEEEDEILRRAEEAERGENVVRFSTVEEAQSYLKKLRRKKHAH